MSHGRELYKRLVTRFCGCIELQESSEILIEQGNVLIKTFAVLFTFVDRAVLHCRALCTTLSGTLGTSAMGRVLARGIGVDEPIEGRMVVVDPTCPGLRPIESDGCASELLIVPRNCIEFVPPARGRDPLTLLAKNLSVDRGVLELLEGVDLLVVGEDLSLITVAMHGARNAARMCTVPKHVLWPDVVVGEHVSLLDSSRKFDVVYVATSDPYVARLAVAKLREGGKLIVHPLTKRLLWLDAFPSKIDIVELRYGALREGLKILDNLRGLLAKRVALFNGLVPEAPYRTPSVCVLE